MTNNEIIINQAIAHGIYTKAEAQAIVAAKGCLPIHTFAEWKKAGFSVKRGEHAAIICDLWKYTERPGKAAKTPAVQATSPGEYSYCYEMQQAPTGCDYAADLAYYGKHYFLRPLRDGLPPLHGRGITYDAEQGTYMVTLRAYDKIKAQYKIKRETCLD